MGRIGRETKGTALTLPPRQIALPCAIKANGRGEDERGGGDGSHE